MAARRNAAARRVALFVEGTTVLTPRGRDDLQQLWRYQCEQVSGFPPAQLDVYGFSKQQIIIMDPAHAALPGAGKVPLDVAIERKHKEKPFEGLIVAFDAHPANQAIQVVPGAASPCLRSERDFVLQAFATSKLLPKPFRVAAANLLHHYTEHRGQPRRSTRTPLGNVELVYMAPMFEALVLQDEAALRSVFGLKRTPPGWPPLPYSESRPDFALREIVKAHRRNGPSYLRLDYAAAKHAWAQEVLKNASPTSAIWSHEIAVRLGKVLE